MNGEKSVLISSVVNLLMVIFVPSRTLTIRELIYHPYRKDTDHGINGHKICEKYITDRKPKKQDRKLPNQERKPNIHASMSIRIQNSWHTISES